MKKKLVAPLVLFAVFACSAQSPAPAGPTPTGPDTLCSQFCGQQQSRGSLVGPLQDCIDQCCANSVARCDPPEGGTSEGGDVFDSSVPTDAVSRDSTVASDTSTGPDTGSSDAGQTDAGDASGCTTCAGACCAAGQACVSGACVAVCTTGSDCASGCCAPATDASGFPVGPYVCKANDAAPYDCCNGILNDCGNGYCCVLDPQGNEFCSTPCTTSASCGGTQCNTYDFSHTTCSGPTACGP